MITRNQPSPFASAVERGAGPVRAMRIGMAALVLVTAGAFGPDAVLLARDSSRAPFASAGGSAPAASPSTCTLSSFTSGQVRTVIDGRTFVFEDGREVRLAALEVAPIASGSGDAKRARPDPADTGPDHAGEVARRALAALIGGREVVLKHTDATAPPTDRYGRLVASGFVKEETTERSLQDALLASGHARLAARIEVPGCLRALRAQEDAARRASLGLWADPLYFVHDAGKPADILPQRGRFAVVGGEVVSVRESGGTIYVNFARRWSDGFSAFILKRNAGSFAAAGLDLKRLKGRRIEVRGFVEQRRGPGIAVERPEQIAIIEGR